MAGSGVELRSFENLAPEPEPLKFSRSTSPGSKVLALPVEDQCRSFFKIVFVKMWLDAYIPRQSGNVVWHRREFSCLQEEKK